MVAQLTSLQGRLEAQEQLNAQLQEALQEAPQDEQNEQDEDISVEDLLTLTHEQIAELVQEGHISEEDAAGIHGLQAEALDGHEESETPAEEASEGEGAPAEAGAAVGAASGEFSALQGAVRELSSRFDREDAASENALIEHHFAAIEGKLTELSSENASLKELNTKLATRCDAQAHALRTGTRPVAFSATGEAVFSNSNEDITEFEKTVIKHKANGKTAAEAIRLAHKESPEAHAKYLSMKNEGRSL